MDKRRKINVERTESGYRVTITDDVASEVYQAMCSKKMCGSLIPEANIMDRLGILIAAEVERRTERVRKPAKRLRRRIE